MVLPAHPLASHAVQLQGLPIAYLLRRSARRSIGFSVSAQGLDVTAPRWVGMAEIEAALQTKAGWIVRKLQEAGQRQQLKTRHVFTGRRAVCSTIWASPCGCA